MNKVSLAILAISVSILALSITMATIGQVISQSQALPSFVSKTSSGYKITFLRDGCISEITLQESRGGFWTQVESGGGCPTDEQTSKILSVVKEAISQRKGICSYFFNAFNGTTIFRYTTDQYCGNNWHSVVVSK